MRSKSRQRKSSNLVVGKKVVDGLVSWRGADLTTELYVGNVSVDVSLEEAKTAITNLGVTVVEIEVVGKRNHFQSFRLRVKRSDMERIKNPDFWPDGIVIRRLFRGRRADASGGSSNTNEKRDAALTTDGTAIPQHPS